MFFTQKGKDVED